MNIFILNTGRCGSTTFIKACEHITNFTAGHETRANCIGEDRLDYPDNHIEADNRLSWVLGRLDKKYGNDAIYIHLSRDKKKTIESFARRNDYGIMKAYREGILLGGQDAQSSADLARDYIDTVEANIEFFLQDKTKKMQFSLENAKADFQVFWELIGAEGSLDEALMEWDVSYNASA
ncbi:MAG: hypothetical protein OQL06_11415 [Gammaproteobacteria bacterium]|nr:hypothetical protein [Gammaproteobacteria bacterium]